MLQPYIGKKHKKNYNYTQYFVSTNLMYLRINSIYLFITPYGAILNRV